MKTATVLIAPSILPEQARAELHDFYRFLVHKYARPGKRKVKQAESLPGTAAALAASPLAGLWKDRDMDDSPAFARKLRATAQNRNLS